MIKRYDYPSITNHKFTTKDLIESKNSYIVKYENIKHLLENKKIITKNYLKNFEIKRYSLRSSRDNETFYNFAIENLNGYLVKFKDVEHILNHND